MRNISILFFILIFCSIFLLFHKPHPKNIRIDTEREEHSAEGVFEYMKQEFDLLKNPTTGKIPRDVGEKEAALSSQLMQGALSRTNISAINYSFQGPNNMAGRIRALCFDRSDLTGSTVMTGGVSGGLFKSINGGITWTKINLPGQHHYTITAIAQDPRPGFNNIWYCGGGSEIFGGSPAQYIGLVGHLGEGVFKSTDNGNTWFHLPASNTGQYSVLDQASDNIYSIVIDPTNGHVFVAVSSGIIRSIDEGATWSEVLNDGSVEVNNNFSWQTSEVKVTSSGKLYAAFTSYSPSGSQGLWTSPSGASGSWTKITGNGAAVGFTIENSSRVQLLPIENTDDIFILYSNAYTPNACVASANLFKYSSSTNTFSRMLLPDCNSVTGASRFLAQGGYDLCISYKPGDPNTIFVGGTNLVRSVDAGGTWEDIGGYSGSITFPPFQDTHPDIQSICFAPGNNDVIYCTDDGGVRKGDITSAIVNWVPLNNNLPTYQYYHVAINPTPGINHFIGGTQDNGTSATLNNGSIHFTFGAGDGSSVGIGTGPVPYKTYTGTQNGHVYRKNSSMTYFETETELTPPNTLSNFIADFHLDPDNTDYLYYSGYDRTTQLWSFFRLTNASAAVDGSGWGRFLSSDLYDIRAYATTRGAYNSGSSKLYVGNSLGNIFRIDNPAFTDLSTNPKQIFTSAQFVTCTGLSVNPNNDNELLAVFSNYGIVSIWHTLDAGSDVPTWTIVEGNLDLPSIRTCEITIINGVTNYYVGTSIGLFRTSVLNGNSTVWSQESADLIGNALVVDLAYRPQDNILLIGTHGSGMFKAELNGSSLPIKLSSFTAAEKMNDIRLTWSTSQEYNNKGFDVEYSIDGRSYYSIGYVPAKGSYLLQGANYEYLHRNVNNSFNYYRLKQYDIDGRFTFSKIVKIIKSINEDIKVLSNPIHQTLRFHFAGSVPWGTQLTIYDINGIKVISKMINVNPVTNSLDLSGISSGTYIIKWEIGNGVEKVAKVILAN